MGCALLERYSLLMLLDLFYGLPCLGAGNTFFPAMVEAVLTWVVVVLGSYVVGVYYSLGFNALWWLFPIHLGLFATIMIWKVKQGDWKRIEV